MKIKKIMSLAIAAAAAVSCMTLSVSAEQVSDEEATKRVAALKEGDCYWVFFKPNGEILGADGLGSEAFDENIEPTNIPEYKFTVLADGTVSVTHTMSKKDFHEAVGDANFVFPETAYGRTVTAIKLEPIVSTSDAAHDAAIETFLGIQTVTIPATVTSIEEGVLPDVTTIYGESGSYAEAYAKERGVTFVALSASAEQTTASAEQTTAPAEQTTATEAQTTVAEEQTTAAEEQTAAPEAADNTQKPASDKGNADTGAEGVAVVAAVALIAAGSVIVCKKRK